jgi:signal peptidase II
LSPASSPASSRFSHDPAFSPRRRTRPPRGATAGALVGHWGALLLACFVILVDQGSKAWATDTLREGERIAFVDDLLGLQLVYNAGAAFFFAEDSTWVFALIAVAATVAAIVFGFRVRRPQWAIAIAALAGAAASRARDLLGRAPGFARGHVG